MSKCGKTVLTSLNELISKQSIRHCSRDSAIATAGYADNKLNIYTLSVVTSVVRMGSNTTSSRSFVLIFLNNVIRFVN